MNILFKNIKIMKFRPIESIYSKGDMFTSHFVTSFYFNET